MHFTHDSRAVFSENLDKEFDLKQSPRREMPDEVLRRVKFFVSSKNFETDLPVVLA